MSPRVGKENQEYLDVIIRNARRLKRLSEDILDTTRIEAKTLNLNKQSFPFVKAIREIIKDYSTEISKSNSKVNISFSASEDIEFINANADKDRIRQVISNLVNNSLKFTENGTITITAEIDNHKESRQIMMRVEDTGTGIDSEILPRLFSKFATKSNDGTGLGLYISKGIIEAHGGKIWAKNNTDDKRGDTFSFSLPIL